MKKIGRPKQPLYDTWINYFFNPSFKVNKEFKSISPRLSEKPVSAKRYKSRPSSSIAKEDDWEEEVQERLYNTKTYRVDSNKSRKSIKNSKEIRQKNHKSISKSRNIFHPNL